ncbi:LPS biosynthesis glycosyltransferase [Nostoc parmelioides]|uniref:LPS biosynthesis glycosyltransferase n=1 Tax=Nostoc parmelioides FACHB-3921 TaxID=2692909 RepID=A0ABR8BHG4_9NOSO|nr:LPS biosynthesis glycosyltransferase [Nostoc parmelioides]MBD2252989.1 LPS biosynthesis glycosyltransferase [Nostoc parmelioides FACHB-3921]
MDKQETVNNSLINYIEQVLIIAHKESTEQLEATLTKEGFNYQVLRQESQPEYQNFSRSYLCLLNHRSAWGKAIQTEKPTLIVEADFVPVVGFGKLPLPYNPHQTDVGISWLYTCAPQVYHVSPEGYAQGFSTSAVAYIVNSQSATYLLELADEITEKIGATKYSTWDSDIDKFLLQRKLKNYIPWRNYGEHGGLPNPEHRQNNLGNVHHADILYGKLAFTPLYALGEQGGTWKFLKVRLQARLKGIARLAVGRFLRPPVIQGSTTPLRLIRFALLRQLSLRL